MTHIISTLGEFHARLRAGWRIPHKRIHITWNGTTRTALPFSVPLQTATSLSS